MTEKWEELHRKERQLSYQLEEVENARFRAEQVVAEFEFYHISSAATSTNNFWEAAYGSQYASQLEDQNERLFTLRNQLFDCFGDCVDDLKRQGRQIEDEMDAIYYAKLKESLR